MDALILSYNLVPSKFLYQDSLNIVFKLKERILHISRESIIFPGLPLWQIIIESSSITDINIDVAIILDICIVGIRPLSKHLELIIRKAVVIQQRILNHLQGILHPRFFIVTRRFGHGGKLFFCILHIICFTPTTQKQFHRRTTDIMSAGFRLIQRTSAVARRRRFLFSIPSKMNRITQSAR